MGRHPFLQALVVCVLFLAFGCAEEAVPGNEGDPGTDDAEEGADDGEQAAESEGCAEERSGGRITIGAYSEAATLDPKLANGGGLAGATEVLAVYDSLMRYDPESGEFEPHLAASLEPNDDFSEWRLGLRDGVTFSNGDALDAEAVKASFERHLEEDNPGQGGALAAVVDSVEVEDDLTILFVLSEPWANFRFLLAQTPGMVTNPAIVDDMDAEEFAMHPPSGSGAGPYEVERFAPGEEIVLTARDDYWGGPVCIEELRFVSISGGQATYEAFQNDEFDIAFLRDPVVSDQADQDGVQSFVNLLSAGEVLHLNNGREGTTPPTTDVRVREAISLAIDQGQINDRVNEGHGMPTSALIHENSVLYTDGVEGPPHDAERASELVEEVLAEGEWDGSLNFACDAGREEVAITAAGQLEAAGMDVNVDLSTDIGDLIAKVTADADFDIACWGISIDDAAPLRGLNNNLHSESSRNHVGFSDPDVDAAIDALRVADTIEAKRAAIADIQNGWNQHFPSVVREAVPETVIWSDQVQGLRFSQNSTILFDEAHLDS